jgi:hypothetical protein
MADLTLIPDREVTYDPDQFWDEKNKTWLDSRPIETRAGGRHKNILIAVTDNNLIYIGGW